MSFRKSQKSIPSSELMKEIAGRTLNQNRWAEEAKYLARLASKILEFARGMSAISGRGAVGIRWPWPDSLDVFPRNVSYLTESFLRSQGMTSDHTTLQAIERYEPNTQAVILLADEVGVTYTHVLDSGGQANCIEAMKKQLGFAEWEALWKAHLDKKG
jgi:hypothetical protein